MTEALDYMATRGISEATCLEYGVGWDPHERAVTFPYYDAMGRQTTFRWRYLNHATKKYIGPRGIPLALYNVVDTDEPWVLVAEGEIDTLTLKQLGLAAVGVPGANSFKDSWRWLFVDRKVRLILDSDPGKLRADGSVFHPGQDGAGRIRGLLSTTAAHVETISLPVGSDVNSLHVAGQLDPYLA
jgi:hypothetical protein